MTDNAKEPVLTTLTMNSYNDGFFRFKMGKSDANPEIFFKIEYEELRRVWPGLKDLIETELKLVAEMKKATP